MGIGALAATAIKWLVRGIQVLRRNRGMVQGLAMTVFKNNAKVSRRVERFFEKLKKVEELHGEHTDFWRKIRAGAKDPNGCRLDQGECRYGMFFKNGFDDTIAPIGKRFADNLSVPDVPEPEVDVIPDMSDEEDSDNNLT